MRRTRKTSPRTTLHLVAYYRVSTEKQGQSGLGLDAQRTMVGRYVEQHKGNLVAEFTEIESGKRHKNRPQLAAALAACRKHDAVLVIAKLDRLARNVAFIAGLMESPVEFVACDMPAANKLTLHIMAAMAEHEREMISSRTKAGLAEINRQIEQTGSHTVHRDGQSWQITKLGNPRCLEALDTARARRWPSSQERKVDEIVRDRHARGETLRQIAAVLNELGLKTRTDAIWHPSSVRAALLRMTPHLVVDNEQVA